MDADQGQDPRHARIGSAPLFFSTKMSTRSGNQKRAKNAEWAETHAVAAHTVAYGGACGATCALSRGEQRHCQHNGGAGEHYGSVWRCTVMKPRLR